MENYVNCVEPFSNRKTFSNYIILIRTVRDPFKSVLLYILELI